MIRYKIRGLTGLVAIGETTKSEIKNMVSDEKISDVENDIIIDTENEFTITDRDKYCIYLSDSEWHDGKPFENDRTLFIFDENEVLRCIDSDNPDVLKELSIDGSRVIFELKQELCVDEDFKEFGDELSKQLEELGIKYLEPNEVEYKCICRTDADAKNTFIESVYDAYRFPYRFPAYIYRKNGNTVIWTNNASKEILIAKSDDSITEWIGRSGRYLDKPWYLKKIK